MNLETTVLLDGLVFPGSPRWHDDRLWFSDLYAYTVMTVDLNGQASVITQVPGMPAGLGWLPDNRLLVLSYASLTDRRLLRLDPDGLVEVAVTSHLMKGETNDMVVDQFGRAYTADEGFIIVGGEPMAQGEIVMVTPEGVATIAADQLRYPSGLAITPDARTLIVAERDGGCLTAFDIGVDGALNSRRIWAQLSDTNPEGICVDAEEAIWVASPRTSEILRVREGGEITDRVRVVTKAFACMLGGPDRQTLFILTAESDDVEDAWERKTGCVELVHVAVPGAGWP